MQHSVKEVKLQNKARGIFIDVPGSKVTSFDIVFRAGDYLSPEGKMDTAHIMEHMVLGANKKYPSSKEYNKEFTKFGAYNNAYTGDYHMGYEAECEAGETERIFDLLCVAVESPLFMQEEFKAEIGNVREELKMRRNNDDSELILTLENAMGFVPKSYRQRIKELQDVELQDVLNHYEKTHTSSNLTFVIAGPIANYEEAIIKRLNQIDLPKGDGLIALPQETPKNLDGPLVMTNENLDNVCYRYEIVLDLLNDLKKSDSLAALFKILFEGFHSRVFGELREKGLAYGIFSSSYDTKSNTVATINGQVQMENIQEVFALLNKEIKDIAQNGLRSGELDELRKRAFGESRISHQSVSQVSNWYRPEYTLNGRVLNFFDFKQRLANLTIQSVQAAAKDLINSDIRGLGIMHHPLQKVDVKKLQATLLN